MANLVMPVGSRAPHVPTSMAYHRLGVWSCLVVAWWHVRQPPAVGSRGMIAYDVAGAPSLMGGLCLGASMHADNVILPLPCELLLAFVC